MLHARCTPHRRVSPRMPAVAASAAAAPLASPVQAAAPVSPAVFEFASAGKIVFGRGTVSRVPSLVAELGGTRVLVVVGQSPSRAAPLVAALRSAGLEATVFCCGGGEPTLDSAAAGVAAGRAAKADLVVGFGGGTAVDLGKAVAALLTQPGVLLDYMEVVGRGQPITARPLPFIAVPTTAGTGSEVTRNAVLDSPEAGVKASLRHAWMLPSVAVVDPELTVGVPRAVTAATGLDALTQCIEPHVCCSPNFLVDAISMEGVRRAARSLERACADGRDMDAREDMCVAAVCGGLSLANAKLGASSFSVVLSLSLLLRSRVSQARCTALRGRWAACCTRPTARCAPPSCRPAARSTWPRCARQATPRSCVGTKMWRGRSRATPPRRPRTAWRG